MIMELFFSGIFVMSVCQTETNRGSVPSLASCGFVFGNWKKYVNGTKNVLSILHAILDDWDDLVNVLANPKVCKVDAEQPGSGTVYGERGRPRINVLP